MPLQETLYRWALRALRAVSPLFSFGGSKLARGLRGRRGAAESLERWARKSRDPSRPTAWFHAPSVGEGFQARAVAVALQRLRPDLQLVHTYFSPSAEAFARGTPADWRGFLPWDLPDETSRVLDALEPDLLVFTKTEVWPVLTAAADERGIPLALVAATLPPEAGRLSVPGRALLSPAFRRLRRVGAISPEDGERFSRLGVARHRVVVTGDPGVDSAAERLEGADPRSRHLAPFRGDDRPWLVAGSTWEPDEAVLLPAATRLRKERPELCLLVAPHEPSEKRVSALVGALVAAGWSAGRLGPVEERGSVAGVDAVVVDRVGVLADLYTAAALAYVGGGFHDRGLHSVLEPAAAGVPVLFGPRHANARSAGELLEVGGAVEVADSRALERAVYRWLDEPETAERAGRAARGWIQRHRGASRRSAEMLEELLASRE